MATSKDAVALEQLTQALLDSYREDPRGTRIGRRYLPSRDAIIAVTRQLLALLYPGYHGRQDLTADGLRFHVGSLLDTVRSTLLEQVALCLSYHEEVEGQPHNDPACRAQANTVVDTFLARLPQVRRVLAEDVQAAFDGDPAATKDRKSVV